VGVRRLARISTGDRFSIGVAEAPVLINDVWAVFALRFGYLDFPESPELDHWDYLD